MVGSASVDPGGDELAFSAAEPTEMEAYLACTHIFPFPRLQEVHYEPWREWDSAQRCTDRGECDFIPAQVECSCLFSFLRPGFSRHAFLPHHPPSPLIFFLLADLPHHQFRPRISLRLSFTIQPQLLAGCSRSPAASWNISQHPSSWMPAISSKIRPFGNGPD